MIFMITVAFNLTLAQFEAFYVFISLIINMNVQFLKTLLVTFNMLHKFNSILINTPWNFKCYTQLHLMLANVKALFFVITLKVINFKYRLQENEN